VLHVEHWGLEAPPRDDEAARAVARFRAVLDEAYTRLHPEEQPDEKQEETE